MVYSFCKEKHKFDNITYLLSSIDEHRRLLNYTHVYMYIYLYMMALSRFHLGYIDRTFVKDATMRIQSSECQTQFNEK